MVICSFAFLLADSLIKDSTSNDTEKLNWKAYTMSRDRKLPKTNRSLLPSINYRNFISLITLSLVISTATSAQYECPNSCECDEATFSARCENLNELIASYSHKQHKSRHNFMPIKSLDLSNSKLTKLTHQLEILVNITELNLSHNQLTQVNKLNFAQLETLDLSHNRITSAKLKKIPKNVIHLNLAHNEITYLPVDFMKLKALRSLELTGNPLNCTCNTLHVRNWMTYHHVRSDNPILCASPVIVKGQPWLQARQNEICIEPSSTTTQRSKYNWDNYEDDNEIMMGDQPQDDEPKDEDVEYDEEEEKPDEDSEDDAPVAEDEDKTESKDVFADDESAAPKEEDEETPEKAVDEVSIDDDFMPVNSDHDHHESSTIEPEAVSKHVTDLEENYDEGSGGEILPLTSEQPEDEGDESGSGMLPILVPSKEDLSSDDDATVATLGIFEDNTESPVDAHSGLIGSHDAETEAIRKELTAEESGDLKTASTDDNTGTYVLLGILALCLISLMVFVAMKNRQEKHRNNNRYDVEKHGATELQDMDKRLLGKPVDKNGNGKAPEHTPLINEFPVAKEDRPNAYTSFQTPEINVDGPKASPRENGKSQQSLYENLPNGNGHVEPVHQSNGSLGKTPESEDELYHPAVESPTSLNVSPEPPKRYSPIYTPASPRSERYSPVYSPETGRVKIKLTETPKPKTPIVVTRSRSRAGEYVNTLN